MVPALRSTTISTVANLDINSTNTIFSTPNPKPYENCLPSFSIVYWTAFSKSHNLIPVTIVSAKRKILVATMLATAVQPNVSAAQTTDTSQLQAFIRTEFYKGLLNRTLAIIPETIFKRCPTLVSSGSRVTVGKPVSFAASGYPNAGAWKQTFLVSGCGNDAVLNIFFLARADEKIDTAVGLSGTTIADLTLQRDAITYAGMGARLGDCKFVVKNTKFEGFGLANPPTPDPGSGERFRPWWETWTLVGCNRTVDVPIDFVPNEKGTQIIQPGGAIER